MSVINPVPKEKAPAELHEVLGPRTMERCVAPEDLPSVLERMAGQFEGVEEHSPLPSVEKARAFLAHRDADAVIAVGGGSSVVTARAATILLGEGKDVRELCTRREPGGRRPCLRIR